MLATSLGGAALLAMTAGSAGADTSAQLPITSFYQVVADTAHSHLFYSSPNDNEILVTDLSGSNAQTITGLGGVKGMALSPDGSVLYAALSTGDEVTAIDTSTLQLKTNYPVSLGTGNAPRDVAVQSGKLWVSYDTGTPGAAAIGDIDLTATTPAFATQTNMGGWNSAPQIAADPQDTGNVLVATESGGGNPPVTSYDTSVDPATVRQSSSSFTSCYNEGDLAVVPGGAAFILACGAEQTDGVYSTTDLSSLGSYAASLYPGAVAIDSSGDVAVGGGAPNNGGPYAPDVYIYHQGGTSALNALGVNIPFNGELLSRGLAWAPDGSELFAVVTATYVGPTTYTLETVSQPTITRSTLTLAGPSSAYITHNVTLTGSLTLSTGAPPAGTPVKVTRSLAGSTTTKTFNLTTAADGSFSLTDKPATTGQYTYTASAYASSTTITAATASAKVTVKRLPTSLKVTTDHATYNYNSTVHVTAHLGTTYTNRTVSIYARSLGSTKKKLLASGRVNSKGNLTAKYVAPHSTEFYAVFTGDAHYATATATRTVGVRVKVTMKLGGYYATTTINGTTYKLYHHTGRVDFSIAVAPNKRGECVKIQLEEHFQGHWYSVTSTCGYLNRYSKVSGYLAASGADRNVPYRIRALFSRSSTDNSNLNYHSGWQYFKVET